MKKLQIGEIPDYVMNFVIDELKKIRSREVIFITQDGYLMNVKTNNRRRIADWSEELHKISDDACENIKNQIRKEFKKLIYGRLMIKIQSPAFKMILSMRRVLPTNTAIANKLLLSTISVSSKDGYLTNST